MNLLPAFQRVVRVSGILSPGDTVVVGVSGGPDSLALLHLFVQSSEALDLRPHAVHLDHRIRDREAEADAQFVASTAEAWGVPHTIRRTDVPALAAEHRLTLEEAARQARYTVLGREATRLGTDVIAIAHNADDQAETVLMHLLRGAGPAGLRGMLPVAPLSAYHLLEGGEHNPRLQLFRPLLSVTRADIEAYCLAHDLKPRFDLSNLDTTYFRNRLRHEIIPHLETVNPNLRAMLVRMASVVAADYEALEAQVDAAWDATVLEASDALVRLDLDRWRALPLALQRATIRRATWHLRQSLRDVSYLHIEGAVRVAQEGITGAQSTLPAGLALHVDYDALTIMPVDQRPPEPDWPLIEPRTVVMIEEPGEHMLPGSAWRFSLRPYEGNRTGPVWEALLADPWAALLAASKLKPPVHIRTRRPGDRFHPQGVGGTQKVSTFQINARIPAAWRDRLPLLVMEDAIAWVAGWRVDERFIVWPETEGVWVARFEPPTV